jgi:hypothetical protein
MTAANTKATDHCPVCTCSIKPKHAQKVVYFQKEVTFYICPECRTWLTRQGRDYRFSWYMLCLVLLLVFGIWGKLLVTFFDLHMLVIACMVLPGLIACVIGVMYWWQNHMRFSRMSRFECWSPRCLNCDYDMRGLTGTCPECGGEQQPHSGTLGPLILSPHAFRPKRLKRD